MAQNGLSRDLVRGTLEDLRGVIDRLEQQGQEIASQLSETKGRFAHWERILASLDSNGQRKPRAKKGENFRILAEFYGRNPGQGFSMPELAERTGLPWSSVRNVVTKSNQDMFEERNGQYFWRDQQTDLVQ